MREKTKTKQNNTTKKKKNNTPHQKKNQNKTKQNKTNKTKTKTNKYTTLSEHFQNPIRKIVKRDKIDTLNTEIHDRSQYDEFNT